MGLVVYLVFGVLAGLTAFRAAKSRGPAEMAVWGAAAAGFLLVAGFAVHRGIGDFADMLFYLLALVSVIAAVRVVGQPNPVHSAVWLITVFLCMAVLFILRRAEFLAAVQVIIYAGAIMVLYVFIIIFVDVETDVEEPVPGWMTISALGLAAFLALVLAPVALTLGPQGNAGAAAGHGTAETMGEAIYFSATLPFEATSLILLVALVGAALIGKAEKE